MQVPYRMMSTDGGAVDPRYLKGALPVYSLLFCLLAGHDLDNNNGRQVHISFQLLCRHYLQSLKPADLENSSERTGLVAERCLLSDVVADAVGEIGRR